jgi:hypothetical protein
MDDDAIEREIQDKGLTAPRVTPKDIQDNILFEGYHSAWEGAHYADGGSVSSNMTPDEANLVGTSLSLVTICTIVLRNGFVSVGTSACASPENFDAEIGRKIARQKAMEDVWKVMGYALRSKLAGH